MEQRSIITPTDYVAAKHKRLLAGFETRHRCGDLFVYLPKDYDLSPTKSSMYVPECDDLANLLREGFYEVQKIPYMSGGICLDFNYESGLSNSERLVTKYQEYSDEELRDRKISRESLSVGYKLLHDSFLFNYQLKNSKNIFIVPGPKTTDQSLEEVVRRMSTSRLDIGMKLREHEVLVAA
jgi:hypothetical protein